MKPRIDLIMILVLLFSGCGTPKNTVSNKDFDALMEIVNSRNFEIEQEWARPMSGNTINLLGNPNYIRMKGDQVDLFLPYYGVRQSGGGYGTGEGGIKYVGPAEKLVIEENPGENSVLLKFEGRQGTENLQFFITLLPGRSAHTSVNSSERNSISYSGHLKALVEKAEN